MEKTLEEVRQLKKIIALHAAGSEELAFQLCRSSRLSWWKCVLLYDKLHGFYLSGGPKHESWWYIFELYRDILDKVSSRGDFKDYVEYARKTAQSMKSERNKAWLKLTKEQFLNA